MPATQHDLFAAPILPGLNCRDDLTDVAEEQVLIVAIDALVLSPFRFQGWLSKRLTASSGWLNDFDNGSFNTTDPIPPWLLPLRAKVTEQPSTLPTEAITNTRAGCICRAVNATALPDGNYESSGTKWYLPKGCEVCG